MDLRLSKFRYETLVIADYEFVKISLIAEMYIKLWMKGDLDLHIDVHSNSFIRKRQIYAKYLPFKGPGDL